jgi:hypothetical protein
MDTNTNTGSSYGTKGEKFERSERAEASFGAAPGQGRMKLVYTIVERGSGKSFWTRVGAAFVNADGSINVRLDAIPINGTLQLRDYEPRDVRPDDTLAETTSAPRPRRARENGHAVNA